MIIRTVCSQEQAESIISLRPYSSVEDLRKKLTRKKGVSFSLFEQYQTVMQGYIEVDRCLNQCEEIGNEISEVMGIWTGSNIRGKNSRTGTPVDGDTSANGDAGLHISAIDEAQLKAAINEEVDAKKKKILRQYQFKQPGNLAEGVVLKDYQMVGLNWLSLLHEKGYSCILADEMGESRDDTVSTQV